MFTPGQVDDNWIWIWKFLHIHFWIKCFCKVEDYTETVRKPHYGYIIIHRGDLSRENKCFIETFSLIPLLKEKCEFRHKRTIKYFKFDEFFEELFDIFHFLELMKRQGVPPKREFQNEKFSEYITDVEELSLPSSERFANSHLLPKELVMQHIDSFSVLFKYANCSIKRCTVTVFKASCNSK